MKVTALYAGGYASVSYLVTDAAETAAVIVDPSYSYDALCRLRQTLPPISAIVLTHGHFDHMLRLEEWRARTRAPVLIGAEDACALTDPCRSCFWQFLSREDRFAPADRLLCEGDTVAVGKEGLTVLHTPGHTAGSICLGADGFLLCGDTVFADGYGRTDLPSGDRATLRRSLRRLMALPDDTVLYPGHGDAAVVADCRWALAAEGMIAE